MNKLLTHSKPAGLMFMFQRFKCREVDIISAVRKEIPTKLQEMGAPHAFPAQCPNLFSRARSIKSNTAGVYNKQALWHQWYTAAISLPQLLPTPVKQHISHCKKISACVPYSTTCFWVILSKSNLRSSILYSTDKCFNDKKIRYLLKPHFLALASEIRMKTYVL